jgi:hypothetical protein
MRAKTPDQVKQGMIDKMGYDFGSLFNSLYNEITWLTLKWIEFRELYGMKQSRIDLLNKVAHFFFFATQKVYLENIILGIARITDPPETYGKKNITLKALRKYINNDHIKAKYDKAISEILSTSDFCRDWRNRWIGHMDYELSVNKQSAEPLKPANRKKIELTLEKIHELYNMLSSFYLGSTTMWQPLISNGGAISLLHAIEHGLRYEEEVHKKTLRGNFINNDFESKV